MTHDSILVPLDGSQLAEAVVPMAARLATSLQASVTLLHVLEDDAPSEIHGEQHLSEAATAQAYLEQIAGHLTAAGVTAVEVHVHENREHDVAQAIVQHSQEFDTSLIMLANHGSGGWREFFFGKIAQQVIRRGTVPVIMIPMRDATDAPLPRPTRIAMALNGKAESAAALEPTIWIARGYGVPVHVMVAVETIGTMTGGERAVASLVPSATRAVLEIQQDERRIYAEDVVAQLEAQGVEATSVVLRGDPASAIVAEAARVDAGLLVLVTHGRSELEGVWTGSVGTRVLSRYGKPLLLVHAPDNAR